MNDEERNVMTIVTIARIVESSLWYCLPPRSTAGFSKDERANRLQALTVLTGEGSPFYLNCENNGETGKNLYEDMHYFIEDVYGKEGRIVTVDINGVVHVEPSLLIELFTTITKLRNYLEAFITSAMKFLRDNGKLSKEFEDLVNTDIRYYHAFAGKISCILISQKFLELNQTANIYSESYSKSHNGIDPRKDPEFNVRNDPSFRMIENEFHELNQDMVTVLNSYGENDPDFRFARDQVYADCAIFTGKKVTTNPDAYFKNFNSYFDRILSGTQQRLNEMFAAVSLQMAKPAEQPASEEAKPEEVKEEENKDEAVNEETATA